MELLVSQGKVVGILQGVNQSGLPGLSSEAGQSGILYTAGLDPVAGSQII